jgi:hypothetical protein
VGCGRYLAGALASLGPGKGRDHGERNAPQDHDLHAVPVLGRGALASTWEFSDSIIAGAIIDRSVISCVVCRVGGVISRIVSGVVSRIDCVIRGIDFISGVHCICGAIIRGVFSVYGISGIRRVIGVYGISRVIDISGIRRVVCVNGILGIRARSTE